MSSVTNLSASWFEAVDYRVRTLFDPIVSRKLLEISQIKLMTVVGHYMFGYAVHGKQVSQGYNGHIGGGLCHLHNFCPFGMSIHPPIQRRTSQGMDL